MATEDNNKLYPEANQVGREDEHEDEEAIDNDDHNFLEDEAVVREVNLESGRADGEDWCVVNYRSGRTSPDPMMKRKINCNFGPD